MKKINGIKVYKCSKEVREKARKTMEAKRRKLGVPKKPTLDERWLNKLVKDPNSDCVLYTGYCEPTGHGQFFYKNKITKAHRYAWIREYGEIPEGLHVLHKCDVPNCVNIDHLYIGGHKDNMKDMVQRNRQACGLRHKNSKLNPEKVRRLRKDSRPYSQLVKIYGVSIATCWMAKTGKTWRFVD